MTSDPSYSPVPWTSAIYAEEAAEVPDRLLRLAQALLHLPLQCPLDPARCAVEGEQVQQLDVFRQ